MIAPPFRSAERDEAIEALLEAARTDGPGDGASDVWTIEALRRAAGPDADLLFPDGPPEMVEVRADLADRRMVERALAPGGPGTAGRVPARVRAVILDRLAHAVPERDAVRRGLVVLAMPGEAGRAATITARTADAIWRAVGDDAAGVSFVTKRGTVASVYLATLLFWLRHTDDPAAVAAFLDRRLAAVARFGRLRRRLAGGGRGTGRSDGQGAAGGTGRDTRPGG